MVRRLQAWLLARLGTRPMRRVVALLALCAACVLAFAAYYGARVWEDRRIRGEFERFAGNAVAAIQTAAALNLEVLRSVEGLYAASREVERHEFREFAESALSRHAAITALQWAPGVAGGERAAFEAEARADGLEGYRVMEWRGDGEVGPAGPRDAYFPVRYSEPPEVPDWPLGFDLGSNLTYAGLMARSRDDAVPVATGPLRLGGDSGASLASAVFLAIYRNDAPRATRDERRASLLGYVVGIVRPARLLEDALRRLALGGIRVELRDESAAPEGAFLCSYPGRAVGEPAGAAGGLRHSATLGVAGRRWLVVCLPTRHFRAERASGLPWAVLALGGLFVVMLAGYLWLVGGRTAEVERLVARRTEQLSRANEDLASEVDRRKVVEGALRQAQEQLEDRIEERTAELREAVGALRVEVAERRQAQELSRRQAAILQGINEVLRQSLTDETAGGVARTCLAVAERLTGSRFGFIGEINPQGRFDTIALSDPGWEGCRMPKTDAVRLIRGMEVRGLWGRVVQSGETLIANDPPTHPASVGVPAGHPPLTSFLGVPLRQAGKTMGMIGLANKPHGYDDADREAMEVLSVAFVEALMRKRAEQAVRQARDELEVRVEARTAELARSNAELEQFAYVASHDLQEPLRMVAGFVRLLAERYEGKLDAEADEFIGYAVDGAERMQRLIRDLLAYSRVGRRDGPLAPTASNDVLERVLHDLGPAIRESGAEVTHEALPTVMADESRLAQVFQNLVANAIKFRRSQPPRIHVAARRQDGEWVFSVRDNGIGIQPKHAERVFMIFQRLHTRDQYPGTGIGLAICKRIIERHGGRIWVESQPGEGSTFYFTLPAASGERP